MARRPGAGKRVPRGSIRAPAMYSWEADMKKIVEIKNISKSFGDNVVLDNINLDIYDNEFITLLGPSGCGKTTLLRIIGGFEVPDQGDVIFMGENINGLPPHKRNVNTVFQRYALFPHLNVFENVAFSLREKKVPKDEIQKAVTDMLSLVALKGFEKRSVTSLSGGQQQRVAIARALVNQPKVLRTCRWSSRTSRRPPASPSSSSPTTRRRRSACPTPWSS